MDNEFRESRRIPSASTTTLNVSKGLVSEEPAEREPLRILFVYAETGAGHRASCGAVKHELEQLYGDGVEVVLFDPTAGTGLRLRRLPRIYGPMVRWLPAAWGLIYRWHESKLGSVVARRVFTKPLSRPIASVCSEFDPHAVVSFHALTVAQSLNAARSRPVGVVVTDLGSIHRLWLDPDADLVAVPSDDAAYRARSLGLDSRRVAVTGLPVSNAFVRRDALIPDKMRARVELDLDDRFTVLLTGGGEGVGAIKQQAGAILSRSPNVRVVVACGRNRRLYRDIQRLSVSHPGRVVCLGFVDNMATWMRAADVVGANAGPGTIMEALTLGVALVLTGALPGQEAGNVKEILNLGAGLYAHTPDEVAEVVQELCESPLLVKKLRLAAATAVLSDAAIGIARLVIDLAETGRRQRPRPIVELARIRNAYVAAGHIDA